MADFEQSVYHGWTSHGKAFGAAPLRDARDRFKDVRGNGLAWSAAAGPDATGTLISPPFKIRRKFLSFLAAGYRDFPSEVGIELLVGGRVVRSSAATDHRDPLLRWRTWQVSDFEGRTAQVRVNDRSAVGWIAVDHFLQTDTPKSVPIDASRLLAETYRPQFHFTPRAHWMNDPNGLLYYKGTWHLFYQHTYPGARGTVWGHAVSPDLFRWVHRPVALETENEDRNFSGSGLVDWENASGLQQGPHPPILLFYTLQPPGGAIIPETGEPRKAVQCMAYSLDGGITFRKYALNPILRTPDNNDRDPKVFFHKPTRAWFMVLSLSANNADRPKARYGLFRARRLDRWELVQTLGPDAWFWECPDMFEMSVDGDPNRMKWVLLKGSGDYILGTFDGTAFLSETDKIRNNWGASYYATQTFSDAPDGRRVQIGWMNTGRPWLGDHYPGMPFNQQMSVPRELTLRSTPEGPRLFRNPVKEIEKLRHKSREWRDLSPQAAAGALAGVRHDLLDIELEAELDGSARLTLNLRGEKVLYDARKGTLQAFGRTAPLPRLNGGINLRILLDRTSIEVFGNRGQADLSGVFYPDPAKRELTLTVPGSARILKLAVHELRPSIRAN